MIGQTVSHYKILEKLGEGGMGIVYKAHDLTLDRLVALKFLPPHLTSNEAEEARFIQEAKAAAALNHPNICAIYSFGEHEGRTFIEMEFVEGKTIRHLAADSPNRELPMAKAITYAIQIGEALQEAHSKGIVHRDIKADNIMVNAKGQTKVMDFGLAKLKGSLKLTRTSSTIGTLAYMAPEQIQGGEVDARSDIFSFGIVLFEMLARRTPFKGEHEASIMYSIVNEEPEQLEKYRTDLPADLPRIIQRSLEKDPEDRYQSVADMVSELRRTQKQSTKVTRTTVMEIPTHRSGAPVPETSHISTPIQVVDAATQARARKRERLLFIVPVIFVLAGLVGYFFFFNKQQAVDSVAVLPFTNVGADPATEYLTDGMTESLINTLSQLSNLKVMSRSSVFHFKGNDVDPQKAGKELGVKAVLTGRVTQHGDNLQISTELVNVSDNSHIWGAQYNKKLTDLLSVQDEISKEISQQLSVKLVGNDEKSLEKHSTENTEAYQLYLKGRFHWNKRTADDMMRSIEYFNQAIEKDPQYALAYAGLAAAYLLAPEYAGKSALEFTPKAKAAAEKALELDATLAEPHAVLGLANSQWYDWDDAEREYQKAIELNPKYPTAHHWYNITLRSHKKFDQAYAEILKAQELDPLSMIININVAECLALLGRPDAAVEQYKKTIDLDPNFASAHSGYGTLLDDLGRYEEARAECEKAYQLLGSQNGTPLPGLIRAYVGLGKRDKAIEIQNHLLDLSKQGARISMQIAASYVALGDNDRAFEWINTAVEEHNNGVYTLGVVKVWEPLRTDPRFTSLLQKTGLDK